ncbi:MAG: hypothetical protein U0350_42470 [Caldilineaceae bacterium]
MTESVGHGWFPSLARFPTGELLVAYSLTADTNENGLDISGFMVSRDNGQPGAGAMTLCRNTSR